MKDPKLYQRLISRIRVDEVSGCWLWTGPFYSKRKWPQNRYGYIGIRRPDRGRSISVGTHRAMLIAFHGPLTPDQCACHRCDVPLCINPAHLFIGTMGDNIRDSRSKNRHHEGKKDHCDRGHPLTGDNVRMGTQKGGKIRRVCKTCEKARYRINLGWPEHLAFNMDIHVPNGMTIDRKTGTFIPIRGFRGNRRQVSATPEQT